MCKSLEERFKTSNKKLELTKNGAPFFEAQLNVGLRNMDTKLILSLCFFPALPLVVGVVNGFHFLVSQKELRRPLLFPPVTTLRAYLRRHWLLIMFSVSIIPTWFSETYDAPVLFLGTAWFAYVNMFAIIERTMRKKKPTTGCSLSHVPREN
jgi:hypothetical protein